MKYLLQPISILAIFAAIVMTAIAGCKKDQNQGFVPDVNINISIYPNSTLYQELNIVGGWMYLGYSDGIPEPSRGLIVYRLTTDIFMAYERTPPFEPDACCNASLTECTALVVDNYYPFAADTCNGSRFLLVDGSVTEGPSPYPMVAYQTNYDGNVLFIYN
jgi:hypothetical protein